MWLHSMGSAITKAKGSVAIFRPNMHSATLLPKVKTALKPDILKSRYVTTLMEVMATVGVNRDKVKGDFKVVFFVNY